jgi:spermidine/putrescine transport system permease protein
VGARLTTSTPPVQPLHRNGGFLLAVPAIVWLGLFFILPLLIVLVISFMTRGSGGSPTLPFTLANYERALGPFWIVIQRSLWISALTTLICLVAGYPIAFYIRTRRTELGKQFALFLVILPFWTNFLVRIYAWRVILGQEGILNSALLNLNLIQEPIELLNTEFSVLLGIVYGFLPFMVLPIYASLSRFDFRFAEAGYDLGANDWSVFWRIMLPMTLPGVIAGCILVFIPAIGSYVTPDLLGGTRGLMIGNLIQGQYSGNGNLPLGAALSIILMAIVVVALLAYVAFSDREG